MHIGIATEGSEIYAIELEPKEAKVHFKITATIPVQANWMNTNAHAAIFHGENAIGYANSLGIVTNKYGFRTILVFASLDVSTPKEEITIRAGLDHPGVLRVNHKKDSITVKIEEFEIAD
jgi:hypothetical protein